MNAMSPRVPRLPPAEAAAEVRTSDTVRAEIDALRAERDRAVARLAELDTTYDAAVLKGDEAAEANEAETARTRRHLRRAELQLPALEVELAETERRETDERRSLQQDTARALVAAATAPERLAEYQAAAATIAAFLEEWGKAALAATDAKVDGPDTLLRVGRETVTPAREETYEVWVHPDGREQSTRPQPMVAIANANGEFVAESLNERNDLARWRRITRTRAIPAVRTSPIHLIPLTAAVALPGLRIGEPSVWPPQPQTGAGGLSPSLPFAFRPESPAPVGTGRASTACRGGGAAHPHFAGRPLRAPRPVQHRQLPLRARVSSWAVKRGTVAPFTFTPDLTRLRP